VPNTHCSVRPTERAPFRWASLDESRLGTTLRQSHDLFVHAPIISQSVSSLPSCQPSGIGSVGSERSIPALLGFFPTRVWFVSGSSAN
jgi:hypothetical protein